MTVKLLPVRPRVVRRPNSNLGPGYSSPVRDEMWAGHDSRPTFGSSVGGQPE
jgi:hypothetical protein